MNIYAKTVSTVVGAGLGFYGACINYEFFGVGGALAAIAAASGLVLGSWLPKSSLRTSLVFCSLIAAVVSGYTVIERKATVEAVRVETITKVNAERDLVETALKAATTDLENAKTELKVANDKAAAEAGKGGCKINCQALEKVAKARKADVTEAEDKVEKLVEKASKLGPKQDTVSAGARYLANRLGGSPDVWAMIGMFGLPFLIEIMGPIFLAAGLHRSHKEEETKTEIEAPKATGKKSKSQSADERYEAYLRRSDAMKKAWRTRKAKKANKGLAKLDGPRVKVVDEDLPPRPTLKVVGKP